MPPFSRRDILTVTATGAAGLAMATSAAAQSGTPGAAAGRVLSDPGPRNPNLERDNPSAFAPPETDKGDMPNFKSSS